MIRRIIAASAVAILGVLLIGVPSANATSLPTPIKLWDVSFSANDCSGKVVVTLKNKIEKEDAGLVFVVNDAPHPVPPKSTVVVVINYPESLHIDVDLTGVYDPEPDVETKSVIDRTTHWEDEWQRPKGCWIVTDTSYCNNTFTVTVSNTGVDEEYFTLQASDMPAVDILVAGNATWSKNYPKGTTVTTTAETTTGHVWAKKDCVTPPPTPSPVPTPSEPAPAAGLPITGASLTLPIAGGVILLAAGAGFAVWAVRSRRRDGLNGV